MKRLRAGIQIIIKVTITLASGKKQVISVTVQKTTVRTTKITGLKSSVTVARNKKTYAETSHQPDYFPEEDRNGKFQWCDHRKEKGNSLYHSEIWKDP